MGRLTPEALVYDTVTAGDPQVSPDGKRVVYALGRADREHDRDTSQLWLSDIDGYNARRLTWTGQRNREPRWSPDGRTLAARVTTDNGIYSRLALIDANTGQARRIGPPHGIVGVWSWSPQGDRILFDADTEPSHRADFLERLLGFVYRPPRMIASEMNAP